MGDYMTRSMLISVVLTIWTAQTFALAQEPTPATALSNRGIPPSIRDFVTDSRDATSARIESFSTKHWEMVARLSDESAQRRQLELDNIRLKLSLQELQLDRADAWLQADDERANVLRSAIWPNSMIEVHWENPAAASDEERGWVRDAIARTWERHSGLRFTEWSAAEASSRGIRIRIAEDGPHCKRLGRHLDGMRDGMVLNFTFRAWCPECGIDRKASIEKIAVHEFGHAIGFAHEQNRTEAPEWCRRERQGSDGDWYITIYDPDSIMNYCNPRWNNAGFLSPLDIRAVEILYGSPDSSAGNASAVRAP